jgi:hypothetical protein
METVSHARNDVGTCSKTKNQRNGRWGRFIVSSPNFPIRCARFRSAAAAPCPPEAPAVAQLWRCPCDRTQSCSGAGRAARLVGLASSGVARSAGCGPDAPPPAQIASSAGRTRSCSANCRAGAGPAPLQPASRPPRGLHPSARCLLLPCGWIALAEEGEDRGESHKGEYKISARAHTKKSALE